MKGTLIKTDQGWVVEYWIDERTPIGPKYWWEKLPLHPDFIAMMDTCFTSKFTHEIEFEIVRYCKKHNSDPSKNSVCTLDCGYEEVSYAKLIHHPVDTNKMMDHIGEVNEMVNHVPDVGKMVDDNVEKLELDYYKELEGRREVAKNFQGQVAGRHPDMFGRSEMHHMVRGYLEGYKKAKENLYTEEQVSEVIRNCFKSNAIGFLLTEDDMMRTIKQSK